MKIITTLGNLSKTKRSMVIVICVTVILLIELVLQLTLAHTDSQTTDEAVHLSASYTYLIRHDFRYNPEHPPLIKMLAALPLLVIKPNLPSDDAALWQQADNFYFDSWVQNRQFGEQLLYQSGNNPDQLLFWARVPMVLLTVLLGLVVFFISRRLWGDGGGLVALGVYAFNPTILAHGHLITTDIGASLGIISTIWLFWRFCLKQSWINLGWFTLVCGLTLVTKFTTILLIPLLLASMIVFAVKEQWTTATVLRIFGKLILALVGIWFIIFATYGFTTTPAPQTTNITTSIISANPTPNSPVVASPTQQSIQRVYNALRPLAIPRQYFKGLFMVLIHTSSGQGSFLLGQTSHTGWWYYFPVVFVAKTPEVMMILMLAGAIAAWRKRKIEYFSLLMLGLALLYLAFAMVSKADLGIRHISPMIVMLSIVAGGASVLAHRKYQWIVTAAVVWLVIGTIATYPFYLSYFNSLVGGSENGWQIANDSNLDWGQDLHRIRDYLDAHPLPNVTVVYSWDSQSALDTYGLPHTLSPDQASYIIINATALQEPANQWLAVSEPFARITPGVFVYQKEGLHDI